MAITDVDALGVFGVQVLARVVAVGQRVFDLARKSDRQFAGWREIAEQHRGDGVATLLSAVPHREDRGHLVHPRVHGDRRARIDDNDGVLIGHDDGLNQLVLTVGQAQRLAVEALGLNRGRVADHQDGGVGLGSCSSGVLPELRASGGRILVGIFAWDGDALRVGHLHSVTGALADAVERCNGVIRADERTASATGAGNRGIRADDRERVNGFRNRQQIADVLEEHDAFGRGGARHGFLLSSVDRAAAGVRLIEQAGGEHDAEHAAHVVVDRGRPDLAGGDRGLDLVRSQPAGAVAIGLCLGFRHPGFHGLAAGHFEIHAGVYRARGGVGAAPIGNHEAFEAPLLLEDVVEQVRVLGAIQAVHLVVCRHHRPHTGLLHGRLERREVDLLEGPFVDLLVDAMPFEFLIVGGEMLHAGDDALALHALDIADNESRGEIGIFAVPFEIAAPERLSRDVDCGAENHVPAQRFHFLGDYFPFLGDYVRVPGCGHRDAGGERGAGDAGSSGGVGHGGTAEPGADSHGCSRSLTRASTASLGSL